MNLQDAWKELDLEKPLQGKWIDQVHRKISSRHPVQRLKQAYLISVVFSVVFLFVFVALLFLFQELVVQVGIGVMIIAYLIFSWINLRAYQKIRTDFPMDENLKTVLQNTYNFVVGNIRYQERVGLFIYPLALTSGYLMGLSSSSGNASGLMSDQVILMMLAVTIIILTPLCWLLTRWMYRVAYGLFLKDLASLIEDLNAPVAER